MQKNVVIGNNGIGFMGLLQILFIALKLTGHIEWSWWLVMSPLIGSLAAIVIILAIVLWSVWGRFK